MLDRYPVYYKEFVCAAGDCPDTCCAGWDVVVDEETAARYAAVEVEHDSDNVDRIWEAAGADPALSDRALLGWLLAD